MECPNLKTCPIFQENVLINGYVGQAYRNVYCLKEKYIECMRYKLSQLTTKPIPPNILPNSRKPLEELLKEIEQQ